MHRTLGALVLAMVFAIAQAGPAAAATVGPVPTRSSVQSDLVGLVNSYRAANGLGPVLSNGSLASAAAWMANDLATTGYFSHTSSDGRTPQQRMAAFGYPAYARYAGENLAAGQATAADVIAGWKVSPAHNAVLLSANFNAIGVGYAYNAGAPYKSYWVADLGGPGGNFAPIAAPASSAAVPTDARAATVSRGEPRSGDDPEGAMAAADGRAMRRFLHLLAVLDRLDRLDRSL